MLPTAGQAPPSQPKRPAVRTSSSSVSTCALVAASSARVRTKSVLAVHARELRSATNWDALWDADTQGARFEVF